MDVVGNAHLNSFFGGGDGGFGGFLRKRASKFPRGASGLMKALRLSFTDLTGDEERKGDEDFPLLAVAELANLVPLFLQLKSLLQLMIFYLFGPSLLPWLIVQLLTFLVLMFFLHFVYFYG